MKLAIVIKGDRDSGKTSTIKEFINIFSNKNIKQMKRGWQGVHLNPNFKNLKLDVYCVPASPSETNITLFERFAEWRNLPNILIVAVQPTGQHYSNSCKFLKDNYDILPYPIGKERGSDWEKFENTNQNLKLQNRAKEINTDIRQFINNNKLL